MVRTLQATELPRERTETDAIIAVRNLEFFYGRERVLKGITLDIPRCEVTAIMGPSGCGKSTFLRVLNRLYERIPGARARGEVWFDGINVLDPRVDVVALRRRIGMVFQRPNPFPKSIFDNVAYGPRIHGVRGRRRLSGIVERALRQAALWDEVKDKLRRSAMDLSGGQQQRLCIARALAVNPEVLLMDEPTSSLDPTATARIEALIRDLARDLTVVIVTHNLQQAARVADRTAFFLSGELVEHGPAARLFSTPRDPRTAAYISGEFS